MFKSFKTAGFNLESTHLTNYDRLDKLLMLVALSFVWAYKIGIYQHKHVKQVKIKKHGRLGKSFFAYGLEILAQALLNTTFVDTIHKFTLPFLSCTYKKFKFFFLQNEKDKYFFYSFFISKYFFLNRNTHNFRIKFYISDRNKNKIYFR